MTAKNLLMALPGVAAVLLLYACDVKDPIYETDHPGYGKITLTTDWSNRTSGVEVPASYTVKVGEYSATVSGSTNTINNQFAPDTYRAYIYNTVDNIAVNGTTTTVASAAAPAGQTGAFVNNAPGWFFSSALDAKIEADKHHEFIAVMRQQVVELSFTVTPSGGTADKIESITGVLGGVAGAMNIDNGERSASSSVAMNFAKQPDGTWKATVRLLGIVGDSQPLTTTVKFTGGNPGDVEDTTDIHDEIDDNFGDGGGPVDPGSGGSTPGDIDLGTEIVETPTETGFTATIKPWTKVTGSGIAD